MKLRIVIFFFALFLAFSVSAQTWQGPPAGSSPPANNRSAPVHVGSEAQTKQGALKATDLEATTGDVKGVRLCIGVDCKTAWSEVGGGSQWTTLGANIYYTTGNVGIGTATPNKQLHVKTASGNAEIDLQSAASPYWAMYQDDTTDQLRFWNGDNRLTLTTDGKVTAAQFQALDPSSGSGLPLTVRGGNASISGGGAGGSLNLIAGSNIPAGGAGYSGLGAPGAVIIKGSNGYNSVGGNVTIDAGQTSYWAQGTVHADVAITGGRGVSANDPAKVTVQGGYAGNSNSALSTGGNVVIQSGLGQGGGSNGNIQLLNGNVGIGTTTPGSLLNLKQSVGTNAGGLRITNGSITTYLYGDGVGDVHFDNSGAKLFLNESGGNVGIGTTSPVSKFHTTSGVNAAPATSGTSGSGIAARFSGADNAVIDFGTNSGTYTWIQSRDLSSYATNYPLAINPNGGNVGIGTASPAAKLEVAGDILVGGSTASGKAVYSSLGDHLTLISGNAGGAALRMGTGSPASFTERMRIDGATGNVGIGTTAPTQKLDVAGNVKGTGICIGADCKTAWPSGGTSQWTTAGTAVYYNGGNVGIGTTAPVNKLEVTGDIGIGTTADGNRVIGRVGTYTSAVRTLTLRAGSTSDNTSGTGGSYISLSNALNAGGSYGEIIYNTNSGGGGLGDHRFQIAGADKMIIKESSGNVGIGTTSPSVKLDITGNMRLDQSSGAYIRFSESNAEHGYIGGAAPLLTGGSTTDFAVRAENNLIFGISSTERMRIASSGNVGIGTAAPNKQLHVKTASGNAEIDLQSAASPYWAMYQDDATDQLRFWNGDNRLTLTTAGSVGIGTVSPRSYAALDVSTSGGKSIYTMDSVYGGLLIGYQGSNIQARQTNDGNSQNLILQQWGGNVGIGTTSPATKLDVNGQVRTGTGGGLANGLLVQPNVALPGVYSNLYAVSPADETLVLQSWSGKPLSLNPGGNNVGIGTTAPTQTLDVVGYVKGTGLCIGADCRTSWPAGGTSQWTTAGTAVYYNGGNVGIGTTGPGYTLDVSGNIRSTGTVYANANGAAYFCGGDDACLYDINVANTVGVSGAQNSTMGSIKLGSGGGTISGYNGNIGIGTTTPTQTLDVNGNISATGNIGASSISAGGSISTNGNIGAGGRISANGNIDAGGSITANSGITPNYDSGWFYVDSSQTEILKAHNFGKPPSQFMLLQCGAISGTTCTTRTLIMGTQGWASTINPIAITADNSYIYLGMAGGWWAWLYWTPSGGWACPAGDADNNCYTAYYKILAWK